MANAIPYSPGRIYRPQNEDTITALIARQGEIAARGQEAQGQIWGRAVENIGGIAADAMAQHQELKKSKQRELAFQEALGSWDSADPRGSTLRLARVIGPEDAMKFGSGLIAFESMIQKNKEAQLPSLEELKSGVVAAHVLNKNAPETFRQNYPILRQQFGPAFKTHLGYELPEEPTDEVLKGLDALGQEWGTTKKGPQIVPPGAAVVEGGTAVYRNPVAEKPETRTIDAQLAEAAAKGDQETYQRLLKVKRDAAMAGREPGEPDAAVSLTPEALDVAARRYLKDGTLPPMGMGKQAASSRQRIINRAAQLDPEADIAGNRASFVANSATLTQLQKSRDAIAAFENTALKNIDVFLETAGKVVDSGSPLANMFLREASGRVLGSPDVARYEAARRVAVNEVAKIVNNPNLSGVLTNEARKEVEAFNPASATLAQSVAVFKILKQDMANRATAYDDQIAEVKRRIKEGGALRPAGFKGSGTADDPFRLGE